MLFTRACVLSGPSLQSSDFSRPRILRSALFAGYVRYGFTYAPRNSTPLRASMTRTFASFSSSSSSSRKNSLAFGTMLQSSSLEEATTYASST